MRPPTPAQSQKARLLNEAADVATPAARLRELALGPRLEIGRLVASNPSTPVDALAALLDRCPEEVLVNPVWSLAAMSDPRLAERAAPHEALYTRDPRRLRELAGDPRLRPVVASNPAADGELLAGMASIEPTEPQHTRLLTAIALHPRCPPATLRRLAGGRALVVARLEITQAAAGNEGTPADVLAELSHHPQSGVRERVAGNRSTPPEALRRLASDRDPFLRQRLAGNPVAPADVLDRLSSDPEWGVREAVASHDRAPEAALTRLLDDSRQAVRRAAVVNPAAPREALARLAAGDDVVAVAARLALRDREPAEPPRPEASRPRAGKPAARAPRKTR